MTSATNVKKQTRHSTGIQKDWSSKFGFLFGVCAFLGMLLLLLTENSIAANARKPAQAGLGNPLSDPDFEEDFEEFDEDFDFDEGTGQPISGGSANKPQNKAQPTTGGISVGGSPDPNPGPDMRRGNGGLEVSGPGSEKRIVSKNNIPTLKVDNESGDGKDAKNEVITDFNFPDADILDIAKTLGRLTGKNFILDKEVKGRVSIISNTAITVTDAWRAFLTALDMNGFALVPTGKYLRIMRQNDAKGKNVRLYSNKKAPNTDAMVTKIFKIKYISAKELENVVRTYANMGARIFGFEQTNTLIITDTGSNIEKIAKMIDFLDVEGFDAGIEVLQVKFASAVELQKLIDTLLPGTQANFPGRPGFSGAGGPGGGRAGFTSRRTKEGGLVNTIIADERTNSLIVHANTKGAEQVKELVTRLDRRLPSTAGGGKVHVVYLQFADAEEMAKTINNLSQNARQGNNNSSPAGFPGGLGINPTEQNLFEGQIRVSADKTTNSLVITASPSDYVTLQRVINKLDIPRDQIYVEVVIMEMNMQKTNDFAANLIMPKSGISVTPTQDLYKLLTNPTALPSGMVLRAQTPQTTEVTANIGGTNQKFNIPNAAALIKALQTYASGNVLATPQLMTMDNTEATFESTDKIPIPQINNLGLGQNTVTVQYQDVPLSIKIKPQLNKISDFIKLDIKAKVSDISNRNVPEAVQAQAFATLNRNTETSVMVADSDTIVLGGLTRDKSTESINKVPLLGDIPVLGWLFKSRNAIVEKTNLMLFITPKIMRQPENVRMVLDQKLRERDEYVEKAMGGEDPLKEHRNRIIRSLPDVKKISNYNKKRSLQFQDTDSLEPKNSAKMEGVDDSKPGQETLTIMGSEQAPTPPASNETPAESGKGN